MGLSFLNKKTWHPGSFANIEKVWIAEQKHREQERKQIENIKKLKEERQIEELKKMQVEAGLIPVSHLQRLDWIYQAPECTSNITTAEEFLLGKPLKEEKQEEKRHFTPVFQESYSNPSNEIFTKIHEDPLFVMKREEIKSRKEIEENPYRIKMLLKDIENKLMKQKSEQQKHKDHSKKEKKEKKHIKDSRDKEKYKNKEIQDKKDKSDRSKYKSEKNKIYEKNSVKNNFEEEEIIVSNINNNNKYYQNYGLIDKDGKKLKIHSNSYLGPDINLYKNKHEVINIETQLKKRNISSESSYKNLTEEEKEKLRIEMENKARKYDNEKLKKLDKSYYKLN